MSDAAFSGRAENPPEKVRKESLQQSENVGNDRSDSVGSFSNAAGGGSHVLTSGNIVNSNDPSTRPDASTTEKLKGNIKGAINGTIGSAQAAIGTTIRNEEMAEAGREKMQEEDHRLGAKRGVMPVGSDRRNVVTTDASSVDANIPK